MRNRIAAFVLAGVVFSGEALRVSSVVDALLAFVAFCALSGAVYAANDVAAKHGASVLEETSNPDEAYTRFGPEERVAYREGWLPS